MAATAAPWPTALDGTIDVTQVFSNHGAFAALRADGSVVTWGLLLLWRRQQRRGDATRWHHRRDAGVFDRECLCRAARRWLGGDLGGCLTGGGDSSAVATKLDGTIDVTQVFSTGGMPLPRCAPMARW
jgi:hypothetical protein